MKPKYKLSKKAEIDLAGIWRYTVDTWSREQADKYITSLLHAMDAISNAPYSMGHPYEHVRTGYRRYICRKHVVFYTIREDGSVFISRVLHEKMDFDRHL